MHSTGADDFFITLAQKLDCFPPQLIADPLGRVQEDLGRILPYKLKGDSGETDIVEEALNDVLRLSKAQLHNAVMKKQKEANALLMKGDYAAVETLTADALDEESRDLRAWAFIGQGNTLYDQAKLKSGSPESDRLFADAGAKYAEAVRINPDKHVAFNNWGNMLSDQADLKGGTPEGDRLFAEAGAKYAEAVRINPDKHEAFYNWGIALYNQAKLKGGTPEGDRLFVEAGAKYAEAVRIKPDKYQAYFNLACLHSLCGQVQKCCAALEMWKKFNPDAKKSKIDADTDFDGVRTTPEFVAFRTSLPD